MSSNQGKNETSEVTRDAIIEQDAWIDLFEQVCGIVLCVVLVYGASASANLF